MSSPSSQQPPQAIISGLTGCFHNFQGAYCTRKFTEFLLSGLFLIVTSLLIGAYAWRYRLERRVWLMTILSLMAACLLANVLFCFFNQEYWLYAVESYAYNLYFLFIVAYVCRAYVLKGKPPRGGQGQGEAGYGLSASLVKQDPSRSKEKTYFYGIFITMTLLYNVIFILSVIREVNSQREQDSGRGRYCQESEYLAFDVLCTAMSIVVMVILHRNQKEEREKMEGFSMVGASRPRGSLLSDENGHGSGQLQPLKGRVHNPLGNVWIWIVTNVLSQTIGLVQSGLLLDATPTQCLIIKDNPAASNYLDLLFTILTMYLGFGATIWYAVLVGFWKTGGGGIDRSVTFSQEVKVEGNIQLFNPSREETVFAL